MLINAFGLSSIKPSARAKKLACITGQSVEQTAQFFCWNVRVCHRYSFIFQC